MATKEELDAFIQAEFPESRCVIEEVGNLGATVSMEVGHADRRPGGTVAGPVLMAVADVALYVAVLGEIGIVPLAVTTSLTINFLRRPRAEGRLRGVCKLLKVGRSLAVGEVSVYAGATEGVVAHVVGTYSIPPDAVRSQRAP